MRLIDADDLMRRMCGACFFGDRYCPDKACLHHEIRDRIKAAPTVKPEQRCGRWIEKPPYADETVKGLEFQIVCSRCDEQNASINFNDDGEIIGKTFYKTKFCPNCGADMREVNEDAGTD